MVFVKRRLVELLEGKRWKLLREAVFEGDGIPQRWRQAVRWYRRASREVRHRRTVGEVILARLEETRGLTTMNELRHHYCERAGGWPANTATPMPMCATIRRSEDAAYGLRWIDISTGITLDPRGSLRRFPLFEPG